MEQEVTKHTRKIFRSLKAPGKGFWKKAGEITIEVCIIVFAVSLSIWFHNWSDDHHERRETREFLTGLKADLIKDLAVLDTNQRELREVDSNFRFLVRLGNSKAADTASDRLITHYLNYELASTHANVGRYEGFKSSGKIGTIGDDSLKEAILVYYQQTIPNLNDVEGVVNSFQKEVMTMEIGKDERQPFRSLIKSFRMEALLQFTTQNIENGASPGYDSARAQAQRIIARISAL